MMRLAARLLVAALVLLLVFGAGLVAGRWLDGASSYAQPVAQSVAEPVAQPTDESAVAADTGDSDRTRARSPARPVEPERGLIDLSPDERRDIRIFREVSPAVVNISSVALGRDRFSLNIFEIPSGTGSGFVWDRRGHIVTNFHVIGSGKRWTVTLGDEDGRRKVAKVAKTPHLVKN